MLNSLVVVTARGCLRGSRGAASGRRTVEATSAKAQRRNARSAIAPGGTDREEQSPREEATEVSFATPNYIRLLFFCLFLFCFNVLLAFLYSFFLIRRFISSLTSLQCRNRVIKMRTVLRIFSLLNWFFASSLNNKLCFSYSF